jgi:branched-chain amino acid transport system substrate-binding protein
LPESGRADAVTGLDQPRCHKDRRLHLSRCFIDPFQGTVVARFAQDKLNAKTAAILSDVSQDYSKGLAKYFKEEFSKNGKIVAEASYSSETDKDFARSSPASKAPIPT